MKPLFSILLNALVVILSSSALFLISNAAVSRRKAPAANNAQVYQVGTQRDAYGAFRHAGPWGGHAVHLNRFFNMLDFFPKEEKVSSPFPIAVRDVRPYYEKGVTSHNWLFIATRTGLVRRVTSVLPEDAYRDKIPELRADFFLQVDKNMVTGYSYDIPWTIATLRNMPTIPEPVTLIVDAGYFAEGDDPLSVAAVLKKKCPDIRMITLVDSHDESGVTDGMRKKLQVFGKIWHLE